MCFFCFFGIATNNPVKVVSEILGHGDIETTLAIYQHPVFD